MKIKNRSRDARGLCDRIYIINFPQNMSNSKYSEMLPVISSSSKNNRNSISITIISTDIIIIIIV